MGREQPLSLRRLLSSHPAQGSTEHLAESDAQTPSRQLPAVRSYRTRKVVFGIERTILCTFNQELFDSQMQTLSREIAKRKRRLQELRTRLENRRNDSPGKAPTVEGVQKKVKEILRGGHMADLFAAQVRKNRAGLPRLSSAFKIRPISISARPCWARPCFSPTAPTGPMSRSFLPTAPNTTSKPTFDV